MFSSTSIALMKSVLLFLVVFGLSSALDRFFSVRIKGQFMCHDEPLPNLPIDIYHQSTSMRYENFMERFTDEKGEFDLSAYVETDQYIINPYIVIRHSCWEKKGMPHKCNRKIILPIPVMNVTGAKDPEESRTFHIEPVDLRFHHPSEVTVRCGL